MKKKTFLLIQSILSLILIQGCWAGGVRSETDKSTGSNVVGAQFDIDLETNTARPACNQYCGKIRSIPIFYTKATPEYYVKYIEGKINKIVDIRSQSGMIKVKAIERPVPKDWYQFLPNMVALEIHIDSFEIDTVPVSVGSIKMIAPSGAASKLLICNGLDGKSIQECLKGKIDNFSEKMIGDFLFDQSILKDNASVGEQS
jgi:hypothetical protein